MPRISSSLRYRRKAALVSAICLLGVYLLYVGGIVYIAARTAVAADGTVDGVVIVDVWILLSLVAFPLWAALQAFLRYRARAPRANVYMRITGGLAFTMTFFVLLFFLGSVLRADAQGSIAALISAVIALLLVTAGTYTLTAPKY